MSDLFSKLGRLPDRQRTPEHELRRIVARFHRDPRAKRNTDDRPSRTATLFAAAVSVGPYVRECGLSRDRAVAELTAAGRKEGLSDRDAARSAERGIDVGIADESKVPFDGYTVSDRPRLPALPPRGEHGRAFRGQCLDLSNTPKSWPEEDRRLAALPSASVPPVRGEVTSGAPVSLTRWPSFREERGERSAYDAWSGLLDALPLETPPDSWPKDAAGNWLPVDDERKRLLPLVSFADWPETSRAKDAPKPTTSCALALDYDDDPAWSLEWTRETFRGLRWVAWTTAHHGRDKGGVTGQRGRVVVHLSRPVDAGELRTLTAWAMSAAGWGRPADDGATLTRAWVPPVEIPTTDGAPPSARSDGGRDGAPLDVDATLAAIAAALGEGEPDDDEPDDDTEDAPAPDPWGGEWRPIGEWWGDVESPPERRWLLDGVFPLGKVGMLAAAGGAGKTFLVLDLAVAIAAGRPWAGMFAPPRVGTGGFERGRVLALLGEEDREEVGRRMHGPVRDLDSDQTAAVRANLFAVPLAGLCTGALLDERGEPTAAGDDLLRRVGELAPLRLIILDPLARFAPPGAEVDNVIATRLVSFVEALSIEAGGASVLLVHHSSQAARAGGSVEATAARGVTGLSDAVRWQANMRPGKVKGPDGLERVLLNVSKNNYAGRPDPLLLVRGENGQLRADPTHTAADLRRWEAAADTEGKRRPRAPVGTPAYDVGET